MEGVAIWALIILTSIGIGVITEKRFGP